MIDGARTALGGYLYQFMGAAGLSASLRGGLSGGVVHEQSDMDVIVRLSDGKSSEGVQFKYSQKNPPVEIQISDLIEVLDGFYRSASNAKEILFVSYRLVVHHF